MKGKVLARAVARPRRQRGNAPPPVHMRHVSLARWVFCAAAASLAAALISTIVFNVPINAATGQWDATNPPPNWKETRRRWEFFQGVRSWLLLIGFVLLCLAVTMH